MKRRFPVRMALGSAVVLACSPATEPNSSGIEVPNGNRPLAIYVVNHPLQYFAERIGAQQVSVSFPAPGDVDPAHWSPEPETIAAYQKADRILLNGAGYARWTERATLPRSRCVDTAATFRERWIPVEDDVTHRHGPTGEHAHGRFASNTWLDPTLAARQVGAVAQALSDARPGDASTFETRSQELQQALSELDVRLAAATHPIGHTPLLFSHPVYHYLIRRYDLNALSLHWEPDEAPVDDDWNALEKLLETHPARWLIWEAAPLDAVATRLRTLGIESVVFDPSGNASETGDFMTVMGQNAAALERIAADAGRG